MITNAKDLHAVIDEVLRTRAYVKRRCAWYRHCPETILVIDLQKDAFGGQYYINLAAALRDLKPGEYPPEERCHVRIRLESMVRDGAHFEKVKRAFNLEDSSPDLIKRTQLISELIKSGADFLGKLSSVRAVTNEIRSDERIRSRSTLQVRRFLKLEQ